MKIKFQLQGKVVLKYSKKRLMKIAFSESEDKTIQELGEKLEGIPALIFTNEDPFKLFQILKQSKSPAAAKPGDKAPKDIIIPAGPTDFTPGPMIGELGQLGIKTSVEGGKVVIKEDKLLVKEGEEVVAKNAELMAKLSIEPMEIGLNLVLTYGNNEILVRSVLDIDTDLYFDNIKLAAGESINLAIFAEYITKDTVELLIKKAAMEEIALEGQLDLDEVKEQPSEEKKEEAAETPTETPQELPKEEPKPEEPAVQEEKKEEPVKEEPKPVEPEPPKEEQPSLEKNVDEEKEEPKEEEKPQEEPEKVEEKSEEKEELKEEQKTELEEEMEKEPEQEKAPEDPEDKVKVDQIDPQDTSEDAMKKAEENLKNLIDKKMKGEI